MHDDEHADHEAIRDLVTSWQSAAAAGDVARLRDMLAEDVVFLTPGQAPMCGRQAFLDAFEEGLQHYRIESHAEIRDIGFDADLAYCWTHLSVTATPHKQGLPVRRFGDTLTILKKQQSRWVIARDANMLTSQPAIVPAERN
ncbi:MAG TPA: SgcJ/EcaC family oxidoreductase [Noviherbaspirillum sp.]|uniref:YybH family protein n=1 Tax=Noviherbaspirillum sp. TaxID=1926288 RepID=UPI002B47911D|nr:SgcJ/EcaC family oxidoreductase [Noviherbaspirillum sp.]HJV88004.1 SgcJ/EcaC family oxidoreductase [Noviherbaspirillum sp.]